MLILIIVSIFFLYLLLFSQNIFYVLNCNVQRFLLQNIYFRQVMIFFTIYFFTFVLDWYTPYNIFPKIFVSNANDLFKFLSMAVVIYVFFILTTCLNLASTIILFFLIFILLNLYLYRNSQISDQEKEELIDPTNFTNIFDLTKSYHIINVVQISIILLIVGGFIYNLVKSKKIQGKKFEFIKFLFSGGICIE